MFFSNPETDRLAELAHAEMIRRSGPLIVRQWMAELLKLAPVIYLPTLNLTDATRTYVHDGVYLPANVYDGTAVRTTRPSESAGDKPLNAKGTNDARTGIRSSW